MLEGFAKLFFCTISTFSRFQNPHLLLTSSSFEIAQALILTKIPGFSKLSVNISDAGLHSGHLL